MKTKYFKETKAITLIALIVSIIVLLILAGVSIAVLTGENGILNRATSAKTTNEQKTAEEELKLGVSALSIDYRKNTTNSQTFREFVTSNSGANLKTAMGLATDNQDLVVENATNGVVSYKGQKYQVDNYGGVAEYTPMWIQDKTTVAKDGVELTVGQAVTGYSVTVNNTEIGDGKWFVLGAEDGKLLITTNKSYETVELSGIEDYLGEGLTKLNNATTKYNNQNMSSSTRTINLDDIKKLTQYDFTSYDDGNEGKYGNQLIYTLKDDGYIWEIGSEYPKNQTKTNDITFTYWDEENKKLVTLGKGESSKTITNTYWGHSFSSDNSMPITIRSMLFSNTGPYPGAGGSYWLGTTYVACGNGDVSYGMHIVGGGYVNGENLFFSISPGGPSTMGLRPVVALASDVNVTSAGAISK